MSCSCAQLPCHCSTVIDPAAGCIDPGSVDSGQFGATFEDNCVKRLQVYRGADEDGTPIDDVLVSPKKAFRVQGEDGADRWKNPPCIPFPELRLTVDGNGYGTNGADSLQARGGQCETDLVGPLGEDSFLKWDGTAQMWKASPGITIVPPCVAILYDLMLTTGVTVYNIALSGPTGSWLLGGVFSIRGHQFKVTAIAYADGADDYVEGVTTIVTVTLTSTLSVSPMVIPHGECVNWKGLPELNLCGLTTVAPVDGKTLFDSIIVCKGGALYALQAQEGKSLTGIDGHWRMTSNSFVGNKLTFPYTGTQQTFTVPEGKTSMTIKLWGALSGEDAWAGTSPRAGGGYTYAVIPVNEGEVYSVIVGQKGFRHGPAFGFGGLGGDQVNASGGGLSGVFSGSEAVVSSSAARAFAVAGGGAGLGRIGNTYHANPENNQGNSGSGGGGGSGMGGDSAASIGDGNGGGGGGYVGGLVNKGGTGFVHATATASTITPGSQDTQPNSGDPDFVNQQGNGFAVVIFQ